MEMARCQDCGQVCPEWFMTEIEHGGVFGEGSTVTCRRCANREWPPLPGETEEEYRVRTERLAMHVAIGDRPWSHWKWRLKIALGAWPRHVVDALENVRWSGERVAAAVHGLVERARKVVAATDECKHASSDSADDTFWPDCACGKPASCLVRRVDTDNHIWKFSCQNCYETSSIRFDWWDIDGIPGLIVQYATDVEKAKRRRKKAQKKLKKVTGEAESAYSFTRETAAALAKLTAERNALEDRCSSSLADIVLMKIKAEAAGELWRLLDEIMVFADKPPYDERMTTVFATAGKCLEYATMVGDKLVWKLMADPPRDGDLIFGRAEPDTTSGGDLPFIRSEKP